MTYYSDREFGERPATEEEIGESVWEGLRALIESRIQDGSFGIDHPDACPDGFGPTGTNRGAFEAVMRAEIPDLPKSIFGYSREGPLRTIDILDLLTFCWRHVGDPIEGSYHSFFQHSHLSFNRELGQHRFLEAVNRMLSRNGLTYRLMGEGSIERLGPTVLREELASARFSSGESELDHILEMARRKFMSPRDEVRREALLELWDAWERLKTTGEGANKKDQISDLLDDAAGTEFPKLRERLDSEALELTSIGNSHQIRHTEIGQEKVERSEHIDYLFHRLFSMIQLLLKTKRQ